MKTLLKVLGVIALLWIGFVVVGAVIGAVFKLLIWGLVIGGILFVGSAAYTAISNKNENKAIR